MRNIKLVIEYDGTNYNGWQVQKPEVTSQRLNWSAKNKSTKAISTIQGILQEAIKKVTNEDIKLVGAGRTDAGVHAKAQVANFHTLSNIPVAKLPFAINTHLPEDIVIKSAEEVPLDFNARRDAKAREYMYVINNHRFRSAVQRLYSYHIPFNLNIGAMQDAAEYLKGEHDFSGFTCKNRKFDASGQNPHPEIRNIMRLDIEKKDDFIYIVIKANSFLMHMVRYMVSALLTVGREKMKPEDIKLYLEPNPIKWTYSRAPAKGLFLMKVEY
jgi:tRNA pseudouridine38-40 synthase